MNESLTSNPVVTPTEADELIRWHTMCANVSAQTDDFAGARWHREKLAQWQQWKGGKRGFPAETTVTRGKKVCDCTPNGNGWMSPCPDRPEDRYCMLAHTPCEHCTEPSSVELRKSRAPKTNGDVP